jgi:hypothetical protein
MPQLAADPFPVWFPFFFVGLWLFVGGLLSFLSGWPSLARQFRATSRPSGVRLTRQVAKIGLVSESGVTGMVVSEAGLYLWAMWLFRFLRPPLLIPWSAIREVREATTLWWKTYQLDIASITHVKVSTKAYDAMRPFLLIPLVHA